MDMETPGTETAARLVRNSIWLFTAETVSKLLALIIQIVAARYLGDKGFGVFAFAFAMTGILWVLADSGINTFLVREISRSPDHVEDYLSNAFVLKGGLSLTCVLFLVALPVFSSIDPEVRLVVWAIGLAMLINGYVDTYLAVFRAFEKMSLVSILMILQRGLFLVAGLTLLWLGYKVVPLSIAFLVVACVNFLIARWQVRAYFGRQAFARNWKTIKDIFMASLPMGGTILFTYIYFRIGSVMLFFIRGDSETGWYSAALKLVETMIILIAGIRNAIFPILSRTYEEYPKQFNKIWNEATRFILMVTLPLAAGVAFLAPQLVQVLYGESYQGTGQALRMMILVLPLLCLSDFISYLLMSANRARQVLKIVGFCAIINIVLNLLLIPKWGYLGAATATCLTELIVFGIYFTAINKIWGRSKLGSVVLKPALGTMGMILVFWMVFPLPVFPLFLLGVLTYLGLLIALQTFNKEDWNVLRGVWKPGGPHWVFRPVDGPATPWVLRKPRKILMIKLGAVGDLVMASAFFDILRKHYPRAKIILLTGKSSFQAVENNPCIDQFIQVEDTGLYHGSSVTRLREVCRIIFKLRKEKFDLAFVMHRAWPFNLLAFLCGIPCRVGFGRGREGTMLTHRVTPQPSRNERETYLDLLRALDIPAVYERSFYFTSEEANRFVPGFLARHNIKEDERLIAIAPGGGRNVKLFMPNKRWPRENFVGLIQKISRELPFRILLFGSPDERGLISDILAECPECVDATGLSLDEVASVFRKCGLFIGNDSGPLHIAVAIGIPTLSFYGPTNPRELAPPGPGNTVLYKQVECSPCYDQGRFPECHHLNCLYSITVEETWDQLLMKLESISEEA